MRLNKGKTSDFKKISGREIDGKFEVLIRSEGGKSEELKLSEKDFLAFIKKHKELAFVVNYMSKEMDKFRKGFSATKSSRTKRRTSRKTTKKTSKRKTSKRKTTRRKSRKTSKRKTTRKSRKTSKRKTSRRKGTKKSSRRRRK